MGVKDKARHNRAGRLSDFQNGTEKLNRRAQRVYDTPLGINRKNIIIPFSPFTPISGVFCQGTKINTSQSEDSSVHIFKAFFPLIQLQQQLYVNPAEEHF